MPDMNTRDEKLKANFASALSTGTREPRPTSPAVAKLVGTQVDRSLFLLAVDRIRPDADQVRRMHKSEDDPGIVELGSSIRQFGVQEPLNVRYIDEEDIYELVAGERRYTAAKLIGLTQVPVKLVDADEKEAKLRQLHENIHREDLHPTELAAALKQLQNDGASVEELARLCSKSIPWVRKALAVEADLSDAAKAVIAETPEKFDSFDTLYEMAKLPPAQQVETAQKVASEGLTRRELRKHTAKAKAEHKEQRGETRGRKAKTKPFNKSFKSSNGATVTVAFRKATVTTEEQVAALEEILSTLRS